ncbi:hypothetical protein BVI061214_02362 [Thermus aquaticus]|uniref:Uncharacterized protein n=1 Tax=Thermus aquaticus TaxID=271 RepID=A0A0M9ABY8_THEAQ|nr:hypothetical protein BVI061214_02362 [Thermus aquaticus]
MAFGHPARGGEAGAVPVPGPRGVPAAPGGERLLVHFPRGPGRGGGGAGGLPGPLAPGVREGREGLHPLPLRAGHLPLDPAPGPGVGKPGGGAGAVCGARGDGPGLLRHAGPAGPPLLRDAPGEPTPGSVLGGGLSPFRGGSAGDGAGGGGALPGPGVAGDGLRGLHHRPRPPHRGPAPGPGPGLGLHLPGRPEGPGGVLRARPELRVRPLRERPGGDALGRALHRRRGGGGGDLPPQKLAGGGLHEHHLLRPGRPGPGPGVRLRDHAEGDGVRAGHLEPHQLRLQHDRECGGGASVQRGGGDL